MIGKRDVARKLLPILADLQEVGMGPSGDKLIEALSDLVNELRV